MVSLHLCGKPSDWLMVMWKTLWFVNYFVESLLVGAVGSA